MDLPFPSLSPAIITAGTSEQASQQMLLALEKANLFLVSLDEGMISLSQLYSP
jgi:hypothetical protein